MLYITGLYVPFYDNRTLCLYCFHTSNLSYHDTKLETQPPKKKPLIVYKMFNEDRPRDQLNRAA